jgi:hypothetical protein
MVVWKSIVTIIGNMYKESSLVECRYEFSKTKMSEL